MIRFHLWPLSLALAWAGGPLAASAAPVHLQDEPPVAITSPAPGVHLVDFGRVAFGNLRMFAEPGAEKTVIVHFGESMEGGRVNRKPPGTVRYARTEMVLAGATPVVAAPAADKRNTSQPAAVLTPPEWGVVLPFRWVEIEGWPGELRPAHLRRQSAFARTWDDQAASFQCSDEMLNRIWELCRYSIKATTFAGVYVDGDRERIPYEADAYINQLCHYACDFDVQMARDTFDHLMKRPTWPTEWASHMIFIAHADWMRTGDREWLAARYESLKPKLLLERARADGLLVSNAAQVKRDDIVDWPAAERDGFVFKPVNTVVNAFHLRTLALMAGLAGALGKDGEAAGYRAMEERARASFQEKLFDPARGLYRDGEGTDHASLHANLFPLAFGLVPEARRAGVTRWLASRGMACSVYAAQYLMEALFMNGADREALALMTAPGDRSWRHMVESGTTITWEAWDQKYKPNQDWNHAWGAAPANLLPRFVLGVTPETPGWRRVLIRPGPGGLTSASGTIPTPFGKMRLGWKHADTFQMEYDLPEGVSARIEVPGGESTRGVWIDGQAVAAKRVGSYWRLENEYARRGLLEVR